MIDGERKVLTAPRYCPDCKSDITDIVVSLRFGPQGLCGKCFYSTGAIRESDLEKSGEEKEKESTAGEIRTCIRAINNLYELAGYAGRDYLNPQEKQIADYWIGRRKDLQTKLPA